MIEGSTQFASLKENFDIVLIVYGMNDGAPYHYSAGQTVNGFEHEMTRIAEKIYLSGADPIFVTTPHPNTHRIDWTMPENPIVPWTGPDYSCSPCYSIRHKNINDILRNSPYPVIDAGAEWIKAVDMFGEDYLFDPGEYVHPNLIGHQLSFWAAIDQWLLNQ